MKKLLLLAVLAILANTALWGQLGFNRMYNYGNSPASSMLSIVPTDSAYFVFGSSVQVAPIYQQGVNILKLGLDGSVIKSDKLNLEDSSIFFPSVSAAFNRLNYTVVLANDRLTGQSRDTFPVIIFYDANGDTIRAKSICLTAAPNIRYNYLAHDLAFLDNGYLLATEKWEYNMPANSDMIDITLIRLDSQFQLLWTKNFGAPGVHNERYPQILIDSGGYLLKYLERGWPPFNERMSTHLLLLDTMGNTIWHYYTPMAEDIFSWDFKMTSDSGYIYCGYQGILNNNGDIYPQSYICKLNANRQVLWERGLGLAGVGEMTRCHELSDGTIVGAGRIPKIQPNLQDSLGYSGYLAKLSPQGDSIWLRYYEIVPGNTDYHTVWDMKPCPDGGFIFCGDAYDLIDFQNYPQRAWVVKTDSFGCVVPGCQLYDAVHEPPSPTAQIPILAYPNPASSVLNVYLPPFASQVEGLSYTLTDMQGRRVKEWAADGPGGTTYMVPVGDLAAGVYVLTLWERGKVVGAKELIIE